METTIATHYGLIESIEISKIRVNIDQIRGEPGNLAGLSDSIKMNGLLQPIIVRIQEGDYEIIAGHRRFLTCKNLGLRKVPCYVMDLSDKHAYEISLTENIERKTMNPIEKARAFARYVHDYGWGSISELAKNIGKSKEYVSKRMKLLSLSTEVQEEIIRCRIR